jgi:ATP-dependent RNA helicase DDX49/DBP8
LTPSFAPDLNVIMDQLPRDRQTLLYTATLTEAIFALQHSAHTDEKRPPPFVYRCDSGIATVATLRQRYLLVPSHVREVYLTLLLRATSAKEDEEEDEDEPSEKRQQLDKAMKRMRLDPKRNKKHDKDKKSKDKTTAVTRKPVVLDPMVSEARSVIVFTGHCRTAEILRIMLTELGVSCAALHSMLSQRARLASLGQFKSRLVRVLIATDVGSR